MYHDKQDMPYDTNVCGIMKYLPASYFVICLNEHRVPNHTQNAIIGS